MHYTTTLLTLSFLASVASVVRSAPLKDDDESLLPKRSIVNTLSTRYITPSTLEPRYIASRHFEALFPRGGGTNPPNAPKRKASQISSDTLAGGTHNAGAASNEPAAKQRKTSRIKKLPAGKKPKLVCRAPKGKVGNPIIIDAQTSKQLHPLPQAAKAAKGKEATAGAVGAASLPSGGAAAQGHATVPVPGVKKTKTGLHRRMDYVEGEQEAPAFVPVQARVPSPKDKGSRVPALGRVLGTGEFAKVYKHRTASGKVIKVIGEGYSGAGMSTARRKEVAESDVKGLIMAGQFLTDDEWGKFKRGGVTFYYITSTRIDGVTIEEWRPYIQAEAQGEEQRLAVVHAVLQKVKERAYYHYYLQRRTIHADPNPWNVLITGNSIQDLQVDFVDWFEAYSCETTEEELNGNLDIYWQGMLESNEMAMG